MKKGEKQKPSIIIAGVHEKILDFIADDYRTLKANNGQEVLSLLNDHIAHLIISDITMPIIDGYELCRILKSKIEFSHIPIILLTDNTLHSKIKSLEEGADVYITKPFSPNHLQAQIQSLLTNRNKIWAFFSRSPLAYINTMAYTQADTIFLERINNLIHENITSKDLDVNQLAEMLHMSRPTLYRKIKAVSNLTPNDLINISRLKKAAELLCQGEYKIFEVAYMVGYNSQTHFGRNFQKQFGMTPSEYLEQQKKAKIQTPGS